MDESNVPQYSNREISSSPSFAPVAGTSSGLTAISRFQRLIESTTYKPGYQLTLVNPVEIAGYRPSWLQAVLHIKCYVPDSTKFPHDLTLIQFQVAIPEHIEDLDENGQRHYLRQILREFEMHQLDEWLRVDGKLVNDPHAKKK